MEYMLIVISVIALIVLKYAWNIKIKDVKYLKELGYDEKLNEITNKLPENREICQEMLKMINNEDVKIIESQNNKTSFYIIFSNSIIIANIKNTFTRIQTIAHECLHSAQNRKTLLFNFIFSNIYIVYFYIICLLTILKLNAFKLISLFILLILGFIYYIIRSYLEMDAMIKAKSLSNDYITQKNILTKQEQKSIMSNYEIINNIGIKLSNYILVFKVLLKVIVYSAICILF